MNNEFVCLKDKFRLLQEIKKLIIYSDTYVYTNFPKEKKHLKIAYFDAVNNLFEYTLRANNTSGNVSNKNQNECFTYLSVVDFYISYMYDLKIVSSRRYSSILRILGNIKKLLYGWMNEESK